MKTVIEMARDQGLPETEVAGVFIVNQDDLGRFAEMVRADERNSWPAEMEAMERQVNILTDALAQEREVEREALFKWLPEGATHIGLISVQTAAGGSLVMTTHAFKYDSAKLKVYVTDNDNEYPGWRDAKDCFFHLNFPVLPLYINAIEAAHNIKEKNT